MTRLHHEITINASLDRVWQVLADLQAVKNYNANVRGIEIVSASREGVGATRHCTFKDGGFSRERVTVWRPQNALGLEIIDTSFPMKSCRWVTTLQSKGSHCLMTQDLDYEVKFGVLGSLMDALLMKRKYGQILQEIFEGMKKYVENQK